jgi:uncharacterized membrane protein (UPF0127 family)
LLQIRRAVPTLLLVVLALACRESAPETPAAPAVAGETIFLALGGETFALELALDPATRQRGLGGRPRLAPGAGMLFVFLDAQGRVVALHTMPPEPPRRPGESASDYERRLPMYPSGEPAQFAIEVAGGRLAQLGIGVGSRIAFDAAALAQRAR